MPQHGPARKPVTRKAKPPDEPAGTRRQRSPAFWPVCIFLTALVVRIVYFIQYSGSPLMGYFPADQFYYLTWARRIAAGNWLASAVFEQGPLYPYLLGTGFAFLGEHVPAALLVQMLVGAAACLLVYDAGRRAFSRPVGIVAGLATAVYGPLVYYEGMIMKEFLSPVLTLVAFDAGLRYGESRRPGWLCLAGAAVGLACLIRENHILLLLPLAACVVWPNSPAPKASRVVLQHLGYLVIAAAICILPATLHNWVVGRELVAATAGGGEVFYIAHGPAARGFYFPPPFVLAAPYQEHEDFRREAQRRTGLEMSRGESSRYWFSEGFQEMLRQPGRELKFLAIKGAILLNDYDVPDSGSFVAARQFIPVLRWLPTFGWTAGLGLVGLFLCVKQGRRCILPVGFVAAHAASILLIYNFGRFRVGMMPIWIMLAAMAAVTIVQGITQPDRSARTRSIILALVAAVLTAASFYPLHAGTFEFADARQVATLAMRHGDYQLAEQQLLRVLDALRRMPEAGSAEYESMVATTGALLAEAYCNSGRYVEAMEQFRRNRQAAMRPDVRQERLLHEVALLQGALRSGKAEVPRTEISAEIFAAAQELCELKPTEISYWALSALHAKSAADADRVDAGLQQAWDQLVSPSVAERGWRQFALAWLASSRGDASAAAQAAREALRIWPDHPYRPELEELLAAVK